MSTNDVATDRTRPGRSPREGGWWFVLRKAHSLTGALPLGAFLLGHLIQQTHGMWQAAHDADGEFPVTLGTHWALRALVLVPLAFHALLGAVLISKSQRSRLDVRHHPSSENWSYTLQRVTAVLVVAFLLLHAADIVWPLAQGRWVQQDVFRAMAARLSSTRAGVPWWALGYMLGIGACAYHFASGLLRAARSWGVVTTGPGRRRAGVVCALIGLATLALGANTTVFLATGSAVNWPWAPTQAGPRTDHRVACPDTTHSSAASTAPAATGTPAP